MTEIAHATDARSTSSDVVRLDILLELTGDVDALMRALIMLRHRKCEVVTMAYERDSDGRRAVLRLSIRHPVKVRASQILEWLGRGIQVLAAHDLGLSNTGVPPEWRTDGGTGAASPGR